MASHFQLLIAPLLGEEFQAANPFDRRLDPTSPHPIAVAFSGGGDSLAALIGALAWAKRHDRKVVALCVDHRLQAASGAWADFAGRTAARLGADFRLLSWEGDKPTQGLAAAARLARHRLIAQAAREAGARVVVFGHTADDLLEGEIMRAQGSTLGTPREWAPSPVWPQGRGLFLLRPLLGERRADLRAALRARGERWIDDPANDDQGSLRARARRTLGAASPGAPEEGDPISEDDAAVLARQAILSEAGFIRISRAPLKAASPVGLRRFLAAATACAGGSARPPRRERVEALAERTLGGATFTATLAGASVTADGEDVFIARNAGEVARGGLAALRLAAGQAAVWDNRFAISAETGVWTVRPLAGAARGLTDEARKALRRLPALARGALPTICVGDGERWCPVLGEMAGIRARSLVGARLLAACAAISKEPAA